MQILRRPLGARIGIARPMRDTSHCRASFDEAQGALVDPARPLHSECRHRASLERWRECKHNKTGLIPLNPVYSANGGCKDCVQIRRLHWKGRTMTDRWLSVEEIADYLGVSKDTVYGWISKREMPAHKVGRLWKFKTDEIDEWVRNGKAADDLNA